MKHKHRCYNSKPFLMDPENYDVGDRFTSSCGSIWELRETSENFDLWWQDPTDYNLVLVEKCPLWGVRVGRKTPNE